MDTAFGTTTAKHIKQGLLLLWATVCLVSATDAAAAGLEDLVSPGELFAAHAREAKECGDCHESFDRSSQNRLCLVCHEEVAADVKAGEGLHGRLGARGERECRVCHTDHKGPDAGIGGLVADAFDHARTDFSLEGAHASARCSGCHESGASRREAPKTCFECHESDDAHAGGLGKKCQDCHAASGWATVVFDHDATKFALEGKHVDTVCESCHPRQRFEKTPVECVACHRMDDTHKGSLGTACGDCHDPAGWEAQGFDHARKTRFALRGAHARIDCRVCHVSDPEKVKLPTGCVDCHADDDDHRGMRGNACADCHGERAWKPSRFEHERDARFALHGAHASVNCEQCHVAPTSGSAKTPKRCVECHEFDDVHRGTLGADCSGCHADASWTERVRFDHGLTDFPLLSLHQLASCEDCHMSHRFSEAEADCVACHAKSDAHERKLGNDCMRCHNPNGWGYWSFDHAAETDFELESGHAGLECVACHVKPVSGGSRTLDTSPRCDTCHLSDSPHDDAYGRDCGRCHVVDSWRRTKQGVR